MAFYSYLSTKIIIAFITKSYQDLFGVRSYINAELIVILIIFVTAFVIAVNTRKKHVSMENNVSPNNIPSEDGQFKYENRLSIISGFILFINILGSIALLITGIVELNSYSSNGYGWIYISSSIAVLLSSFLLHSFFIVVKEISINIKKKK